MNGTLKVTRVEWCEIEKMWEGKKVSNANACMLVRVAAAVELS
mgnify:FL=1